MLMVLEPGEKFEHAHRDASITELLTGSVDLSIEGTRTRLLPGVAVPVDAETHHTLLNVGHEPAIVKCLHIVGQA
jgi:uncharacterized cupin superfamily protein